MAKMGFEEEFDNFLDLMVQELVGVIGGGEDDDEDADADTAKKGKDRVAKRDPVAPVAKVAKRDVTNPAKDDTSDAVNSAVGAAPLDRMNGTDEKLSEEDEVRPKSGEVRPKLITVEYTYTDETSDAKVTFPTKKDVHTAAEVSFALAYALADVTMAGVGRAAYKGEKEEIANKILQVIARELVKGSLMREIFKD